MFRCPDNDSVFFYDRGWWRQILWTTTRSLCQGLLTLLEALCVRFSERVSLLQSSGRPRLWGPEGPWGRVFSVPVRSSVSAFLPARCILHRWVSRSHRRRLGLRRFRLGTTHFEFRTAAGLWNRTASSKKNDVGSLDVLTSTQMSIF